MNRTTGPLRACQAPIPLLLLMGLVACEPNATGVEDTTDDFIQAPSFSLESVIRSKAVRGGTHPSVTELLGHLPGRPPRSQQLGTCRTLIGDPNISATGSYRSGRIELEFDDRIIETSGGRLIRYRYWRAEQHDEGLRLTRFASCLIPGTDEAIDQTWEWFLQRTVSEDHVAMTLPGVPWRQSHPMLAAVMSIFWPRSLHAAQEIDECTDEDPMLEDPCEIDGIDVTVPPPDDPPPPDEPQPSDDPPSTCDPVFETCDGSGGTPGGGSDGNDGQDECLDEWEECEAPLDFELNCPGSVLRAGSVSCTVTGDTDQVQFSWSFDPDPVTIYPKVGPEAVAIRVTRSGGGSSWGGQMVVPGTITVVGTRDMDPTIKTARISVTDRGWSTAVAPVLELNGQSPSTVIYPGQPGALWGENTMLDGTSGIDFQGDPLVTDVISDGGPNDGYVYAESSGYALERAYALNVHIKPNGPKVLTVNGVQYNNWDGLIQFTSYRPEPLRDGVTAHETYGAGGGMGHHTAIERAVLGERCGNVNRTIERIAGSSTVLGSHFPDAITTARTFIQVATLPHWQVKGNYNGPRFALQSGSTVAPSGPLDDSYPNDVRDPVPADCDADF